MKINCKRLANIRGSYKYYFPYFSFDEKKMVLNYVFIRVEVLCYFHEI